MKFFVDDIVSIRERKPYKNNSQKFRVITIMGNKCEIVSGKDNRIIENKNLELKKGGHRRKKYNKVKKEKDALKNLKM